MLLYSHVTVQHSFENACHFLIGIVMQQDVAYHRFLLINISLLLAVPPGLLSLGRSGCGKLSKQFMMLYLQMSKRLSYIDCESTSGTCEA